MTPPNDRRVRDGRPPEGAAENSGRPFVFFGGTEMSEWESWWGEDESPEVTSFFFRDEA